MAFGSHKWFLVLFSVVLGPFRWFWVLLGPSYKGVFASYKGGGSGGPDVTRYGSLTDGHFMLHAMSANLSILVVVGGSV